MRKGNEILTLAELLKINKNGIFVDDHYIDNMVYLYQLKQGTNLYSALPDYKELTQRVFDGMDKDYISVLSNNEGELFCKPTTDSSKKVYLCDSCHNAVLTIKVV